MATKRDWPMSKPEWEEMVTDIKKMSGIDFMMMDIHRPLTAGEIEEVNPQAAVDKSYPHEAPLPGNVVELEGLTRIDLTAVEVLRNAFNAGMKEIVIAGVDDNGEERWFRTNASIARAAWHLQRAIHNINMAQDEYQSQLSSDEEPPPKGAA